jgi:signal transduction histidine kinase
MKLTVKFVSLIVFAVVAVIAWEGYLSVRREIQLFDSDMRRDARLLGRSLKAVLADVWESKGMEDALQLLEAATEEEHLLRIRWVWLDAPPGSPHAPEVRREVLDAVARGEESALWSTGDNGEPHLLTYVPVVVSEGRAGALELAESSSARDAYIRSTVVRTFVLASGLVLLSSILSLVLGVVMIGRPLRLLSRKAERVGAGDFSDPIALRGRDELCELGASLNRMCDQLAEARDAIRKETESRIAALEQLRHADRLKTVGTLASGVAHELGTPLNVVSGRARLIASGDLCEAEVVESANIVRAQSERMTAIIRQLLDFARSSSTERTDVDLRQIVEQCLNLLAPMARKRNATLRVATEARPCRARANSDEIQQVVMNLIVNALQAFPQGGTVEVGLGNEHKLHPQHAGASEQIWACLSVRDDGEGMSNDILGRLFDPFFTTKDVGEGTGLGLSIVHGIVQDHGGWIDVESELGKGSCFYVYLPTEEAAWAGES